MLELKTKKELASAAHSMATSFQLVRHRGALYMPVDYETNVFGHQVPDPKRTVWTRLTREELRRAAASQHSILFQSEGELQSFEYMTGQFSDIQDETPKTMLMRTHQGLKELMSDGKTCDPSGLFIPNAILPMLNDDPDEKARVFKIIEDWLDSEDEARSLLAHVATSLAPAWPAVKYILLLGEGRNGKSTFLKMLVRLYGAANTSNVTRLDIAEKLPTVTDLNGKLLNVVFDGPAEYLKDSGMEKSLIAGEPISIRKLYESTPTIVQTNGLFIEGLNQEPKSKDKSSALQKRLVRYQFPNTYALDHRFERSMLTEPALGALLSLLLDHFVTEDAVATALAPTAKALELQVEHQLDNSLGAQFLQHLHRNDMVGANVLLDLTVPEVATRFKSWRVSQDDIGQWPESDVMKQLNAYIITERKSVRTAGKVTKIKKVTALKPEGQAILNSMEGTPDGSDSVEALVAE
jgi:hypothetical protein